MQIATSNAQVKAAMREVDGWMGGCFKRQSCCADKEGCTVWKCLEHHYDIVDVSDESERIAAAQAERLVDTAERNELALLLRESNEDCFWLI